MSARLLVVIGVVFVAWSSSGCYTLRADLPGALRSDIDDDVEILDTIELEVTHTYFLNGLVRRPPADLFADQLLAAVERAGGDGVANIVIEARFTPADVVLQNITFGVVAPRTYRLRADIVRIRAPALPGRRLLGAERAPKQERR